MRSSDKDAKPSNFMEKANPFQKASGLLQASISHFQEEDIDKKKLMIVHYEAKALMTLPTLVLVKGTVWQNRALWKMMGLYLLLAIVLATFVWFVVPDPGALDASKFSQIATFLKVFLAFLLGFFMSSSAGRWSVCVDGLLNLFEAVRNLAMQLHALGVEQEKIWQVVRFGLLACECLIQDLEVSFCTPEEQKNLYEKFWDHVEDKGLCNAKEREIMGKSGDKAGLLWVWVASYIGRLAKDGDIPPMLSPTYGRIMTLTQSAQDGIRTVKTSVGVQIPFIYVHMLATLVQLNNILCSLTLGLTMGSSLGAIGAYYGLRSPLYWHIPPQESKVTPGQAGQAMVVSMFACLTAPLMYQAFLQISLALAQPFAIDGSAESHGEAAVPSEHWMNEMIVDLKAMEMLSQTTPGWEPPNWKKAAAETAAKAAAKGKAAPGPKAKGQGAKSEKLEEGGDDDD
eukprot:gnl/MRDRNA2_/MRDRNA2_100025_c0_seq1.p1 gnl/MRDRNA2_/MRDRNA2_100025_c0~~gnl/MRDRNA2_/MRDRNA2_100025_c0_seq1.p1  ORF type:complete len:455 (-),score=111.24 gnl/MRDRNA2_/MRDRNA2_100025_c0_seq1:53-1417(-)